MSKDILSFNLDGQHAPAFPNIEEIVAKIDGHDLRIGIVVSRFNHDICDSLLDACVSELQKNRVSPKHIQIFRVPGALEIPIVLQALAKKSFHALIALGCVIRGETYHFELVANQSTQGVNQIALAEQIPIVNGILTTNTRLQAQQRMLEKGRDGALTAIEMARLMEQING